MQGTMFSDVILFVLFELAFIFVIFFATGIYRYAQIPRFRLWVIGWAVSCGGAVMEILRNAFHVEPVDIFASLGMLIGALLIIAGTKGWARSMRTILYFVIPACGYIVFGIVGLVFLIRHEAFFGPVGLLVAYACASSIWEVLRPEVQIDSIAWWAIIGFALWGFSSLIVPLGLFIPVHALVIVLHPTGLVITGVSLYVLLMSNMSRNQRAQYHLSQVMTGVVQHDIRNLIHIASTALETVRATTPEIDETLSIAEKALEDITEFTEEMKRISSALIRFEPSLVPTQLGEVVENVKRRVLAEHGLESDCVKVNIDDNQVIYSNGLVKELLWNIADNAFRHGSQDLSISSSLTSGSSMTLTLSDTAAGLSSRIKDYLNAPASDLDTKAPGVGFGIVLIRALTVLSGCGLRVADQCRDSLVIGTTFSLVFSMVEKTSC